MMPKSVTGDRSNRQIRVSRKVIARFGSELKTDDKPFIPDETKDQPRETEGTWGKPEPQPNKFVAEFLAIASRYRRKIVMAVSVALSLTIAADITKVYAAYDWEWNYQTKQWERTSPLRRTEIVFKQTRLYEYGRKAGNVAYGVLDDIYNIDEIRRPCETGWRKIRMPSGYKVCVRNEHQSHAFFGTQPAYAGSNPVTFDPVGNQPIRLHQTSPMPTFTRPLRVMPNQQRVGKTFRSRHAFTHRSRVVANRQFRSVRVTVVPQGRSHAAIAARNDAVRRVRGY